MNTLSRMGAGILGVEEVSTIHVAVAPWRLGDSIYAWLAVLVAMRGPAMRKPSGRAPGPGSRGEGCGRIRPS